MFSLSEQTMGMISSKISPKSIKSSRQVLYNMKYIVSIAEMVGKLMNWAVAKCRLCDIEEVSTQLPTPICLSNSCSPRRTRPLKVSSDSE